MLEIPEAITMTHQLKNTVIGKTVVYAIAASSPHGFAWYAGDPVTYGDVLTGLTIEDVQSHGGQFELWMGDMRLCFNDGTNLRYLAKGAKRPEKHQLLMEFEDGDALVCTIQMYGGIILFKDGTNDSFYYLVSKERPNPLTDAFDLAYFTSLLKDAEKKLSAKAFLATQQRIPGLGNGVCQDILWNAKIHPKRKMNTVPDAEFETLFHEVKQQLALMTEKGGRDTEKDLFGNKGGYITTLSKNNVGLPCPVCGTNIKRMAYLGGNVYVCEGCQGVY